MLLHPELANSSLYIEYVSWCGLACPSQLFREDILNLFKSVAADNLVLTIFRDKVRDDGLAPHASNDFTFGCWIHMESGVHVCMCVCVCVCVCVSGVGLSTGD